MFSLVRRSSAFLALLSLVAAAPGARPAGAAGAASCAGPAWPRAGLERLAAGGFAVPAADERERLALALLPCLESPDPGLRDDIAFTALSQWLRAKELASATVVALGGRLVETLAAPPDAGGFRRPFAALALAEVARADRLDASLPDALLQEIIAAAATWIESIDDYRGFDPVEGWRHAVAHGADLVLQLGLNPRLAGPDVERLLRALARQVAPAGPVFYTFGEPDRIARTVFFLHQREAPDAAFWDSWFARIGDPAPFESWGDTYRTVEGLARRHDTLAFLHAVAFAARANPSPASERLAALADRELVKIHAGG